MVWDAVTTECDKPDLDATLRCIDKKAFRLQETLKFNEKTPNESRWREDITLTHYGRWAEPTESFFH